MKWQWSKGMLVWAVLIGVISIGLTVLVLHALNQKIIEETGINEIREEFVRDGQSVKRIIQDSSFIRDTNTLEQVFSDILELSPGIRRLSLYELSPDSSVRILSSDPDSSPTQLNEAERQEIVTGRSFSNFDMEGSDRGLVLVEPLVQNGQVTGALRARFSLWTYEGLISKEAQLAKYVGVGAVLFTTLIYFGLIRITIHRPMAELLKTMKKAETGLLSIKAPLTGALEIQELAHQFNHMLDRVREALETKEQLLGELHGFNEKLVTAVDEAKEELHRANLLLGESRIRTERASKFAALGELSAMMAHELGNPLNAISGHVQLLQKEIKSEKSNQHLVVIRAEIDRMIASIQRVLDSTRMPIQFTPVDLNAIMQDIHALIAPNLSVQRIKFKADLAPSLPLVAGDRQALHGVIFNLVTNAIQAMPNGGELEIVTCVSSKDGVENMDCGHAARLRESTVRLTVRDSGFGIAHEDLPQIFAPFFTTKHHEGGTGLGLAICRRVIVSLGGRIGVDSIIGQGARFTMELPMWNEAR